MCPKFPKIKEILDRFFSLPPAVPIFLIVNILLAMGLIGNLEDMQWDFKKDYAAAKAYVAGQNPYGVSADKVGGGWVLPYNYPPPTLLFFRFFTYFGDQAAPYANLALRAILLSLIICVWAYVFLEGQTDEYFSIFCFMAYNQAITMNISSGNVSLIEESLLWAAFYFLVKRRLILYSTLILAAAAFKITPILFLLLLLPAKDGKAKAIFLASASAFAIYLLAPYALSPALFSQWFDEMVKETSQGYDWRYDSGVINQSTYSLLADVFALLSKAGLAFPASLTLAAYLLATALILYVSLKTVRSITAMDAGKRDITLVLFACTVYALIMPRFKDYSYMLLIAPTYHIIRQPRYRKHYLPLLLLAALPGLYFLPKGEIISLLQYIQLLAAYVIWALYVKETASPEK